MEEFLENVDLEDNNASTNLMKNVEKNKTNTKSHEIYCH